MLDLRRVRYIDSAGVGELVQCHAAARTRGGALTLRNVTRRISDLLVVTKLLPIFDVADDDADALAGVSLEKNSVISACDERGYVAKNQR